MNEYKARKKDFQYDILELKLFFENGDVIAIDGSEVMDLKVRFYDSLVAFQDSCSRYRLHENTLPLSPQAFYGRRDCRGQRHPRKTGRFFGQRAKR